MVVELGRGAPWRQPGVEPPLLGREAEFDVVRRAFQRALDGQGCQLVTVQAEEGLGKSRFVELVRARAGKLHEDARLVSVGCRAGGAPRACVGGLVKARFYIQEHEREDIARRKLLDGVKATLRNPLAEELAHLVGHLLGLPWRDSAIYERYNRDEARIEAKAQEALARLLSRDAERDPLVLVLDDLHLAGPESRALVRFLWENLGAARVLLLCTATGELDEADPWFVEGGERKGLVRLRPLSDEDTRALAQELTKRAGPLPEPLLHLLCARALGHPLRVEQLLTILFHHKVIDASALPWTVHLDRLEGVALPDSAQGLARARLESLEPRERRLLALAALFGGDSWVEAVVCLDRLGRPPAPLDLDEQPWPGGAEDQRAREALEGLVGRDLLRVRADTALAGCRGLYFKHEIERRLALELAELSGPERARLHAVCAQWLEIASRRTQARRPVLRLLAQHHELAGHPERAARAWTEAGQEEAAQHRHHDARACFEQAQRLATADELELRLDILHGLGGALERLSEHERASQSYAEFLEVAAGLGHRSKVAVGFNKLGRVRRALGRYEAALQLLQRAKALFEEAHDLDGVAASQDDVGQVYAYQGRYEEAEACFRTALELRPQEGDPRARALALHHLGAVRMGLGDFKEALALMRQALELRRAVGDRRGVASTLNNLAVIFHQRGELPEARTLFVEAATIAHELGDRSLRAVLLNNLGEIALMLGDLDAARQDLQQAEALSQELGERHTRFDALLNLGKLAQRSGEHDHAARYTEEALGCARELGSKEQEGVALRALGDVRAATLFVDDFARQGQAEGSAQECYQESIRLLAEVGNAAEHGRSLSAYGNWLLERGMVVQGRQQLEQAKDIFSRLEMKKSLQKTEQLINEL